MSGVTALADAQIIYGSGRDIVDSGKAPGFEPLLRDVWRERGFGDFWGYALLAEGAAEAVIEVELSSGTRRRRPSSSRKPAAGPRISRVGAGSIAGRSSSRTATSTRLIRERLIAAHRRHPMQESDPGRRRRGRPLDQRPCPRRTTAAAPLEDPRALQILSTEHWSLLAGRSLAYNEAFSRAGMFLTFLSATLIVIGFLIGSQGLSRRPSCRSPSVLLLADLFIGARDGRPADRRQQRGVPLPSAA